MSPHSCPFIPRAQTPLAATCQRQRAPGLTLSRGEFSHPTTVPASSSPQTARHAAHGNLGERSSRRAEPSLIPASSGAPPLSQKILSSLGPRTVLKSSLLMSYLVPHKKYTSDALRRAQCHLCGISRQKRHNLI